MAATGQGGGLNGALAASGIAKQTPDQRAVIEAVMFALWAQGHQARPTETKTFLALFSRVAALMVEVLVLPRTLLQSLPGVVVAAAFVLAASYASNWSLTFQSQSGLFLIAILVLFKDQILRRVREFQRHWGCNLTWRANPTIH
ncbi:hypothetical protein [Mesorhizobium argentiipisi]|uniref:Uncharacterized protein n=1 Tax=Mesorhizobium argentiipisi TaxID=3015175 RepID=A0ABU8KFF7_9HYPH